MTKNRLPFFANLSFGLFLLLVGCASVSSTGVTPPQQPLPRPGSGTVGSCGKYYSAVNFYGAGGYALDSGSHYVRVFTNNVLVAPTNYYLAVSYNTNTLCAVDNYDAKQKIFDSPAYPHYYFTVCFTAKLYSPNTQVKLDIEPTPAP